MAKFSFYKKETATDAKVSLALSGISLVAVLVLVILSSRGIAADRGILGAVGLAAALLSVYAFFLGIRTLARRDSRIRIAAAATIAAGVMVILWVALFLAGVS